MDAIVELREARRHLDAIIAANARESEFDNMPASRCAWRAQQVLDALSAIEEALAGRDGLLAALLNLANAADEVGVRFFDTDTMEPEVEAMQAATQAARVAIAKAAPSSSED